MTAASSMLEESATLTRIIARQNWACASLRDRYEQRSAYAMGERLLGPRREADGDAVLIAAIWHDAGYARPGDAPHGERSAALFRERAPAYGIVGERAETIARMIAEHSQKDRIGSAPLELTLLMEADELDETGAMGALWDAMGEGAKPVQSYRTPRSSSPSTRSISGTQSISLRPKPAIYDEKRALLTEFVRQARRDLEEYGQD